MKYIELFAGCGGLSLGLQSIGFENLMASELSPMAAKTYAYNFHQEDLADPLYVSKLQPSTVWLSSAFPRSEINRRFRENPSDSLPFDSDQCFSDTRDLGSLRGKLVVGNIKELNRLLSSKPELVESINDADLVSGGPPCQSFSMAGLRELSNNRNTLPWDFIQFVSHTQPKLTLLENVSGILKAFKKDGKPYYAWLEIAKGFASIGYIPLCLHVNARLTGVAQTRQRFILIAFRSDFFNSIYPKLNESEVSILNPSKDFFTHINSCVDGNDFNLEVHNLTNQIDPIYQSTLLAPLFQNQHLSFSVKDAIDDLSNPMDEPSLYAEFINKTLSIPTMSNQPEIANHAYRVNTHIVKRRFRIYQVLSQVDPSVKNEVTKMLRGTINELPLNYLEQLIGYDFLLHSDSLGKLPSTSALNKYLKEHLTKKNSQKALIANKPAPSALSIPDDICHYDKNHLRTLTVREMARIQSFPDNFVFKSKITTGGKNRRFEVPQYTQVGNAIPPILGSALGSVIKNILEKQD